MAGRTAIATPTDVYPNNGDCINFDSYLDLYGTGYEYYTLFTFTNQCDTLTFATKDIYDATTDEFIGRYTLVNGSLNDGKFYLDLTKGDTFKVWTPKGDKFISGRHYKYKITCYTHFVDESAHNLGIPNCCVPYASGKIQYIQDNRKSIRIQEGISKLREPYYWHEGEDNQQLIGCTYLRIGNEQRMVVSYDSSTGYVIVDKAFSEEAVPEIGDVNPQYFLNCNYIEDGWYDFYYREEIESKVSAAQTYAGLRCKTTYSHPNNIGLEKYRFKIYALNGDSYINGTVQTVDDESKATLSYIPIEKGISENIVGNTITFEYSLGASSGDYVGSGYSRTISSYNSVTGFVTLTKKLVAMPKVGTKYSIYRGEQTLIADSGDLRTYDLSAEFSIYTPPQNLAITCDLTTYEKQTRSVTISYTPQKPELSCPITSAYAESDNDNQRVIIHYTANKSISGTLKLYRRSADEMTWKLVTASQGNTVYTKNQILIDYTAGNKVTYEYMLMYCAKESLDSSTYDDFGLPVYNPAENYLPSDTITAITKWDGWTISSLLPTEEDLTRLTYYAKRSISTSGKDIPFGDKKLGNQYTVGETWHFISDINSGDIAHNLGLVTHVGTSTYPTVSRTNNAYESGSFSANLLSLICPSGEIYDDIEKVNRWKKFINGDNLFLLKSDKGDVWIISISENISRTYDESTYRVLTSVSYSWVEVMNINDVLIV